MVGDDVKRDDDAGDGKRISHKFGGEASVKQKQREQRDLQKQKEHDEKSVAKECAKPFFLFFHSFFHILITKSLIFKIL